MATIASGAPSWSSPLASGGDMPPLDIVASLWRRRQLWEKRNAPPPSAQVSTFVSWEQLHPCRVEKLPETLFDAVWPHAGRAVVLYWSVSEKKKKRVVQVHGTVLPQRELGYQLRCRWDASVPWNTTTHVPTAAAMTLDDAAPGVAAAAVDRPLGDLDYRRSLSINVEATVDWLRRLRDDVDERVLMIAPSTPTSVLPKPFRQAVRWLGDADAHSGRAMSFLLRLAAIDAERRGWPVAAADYVLGAHAALWRRYQQLFYDDDEATLLRDVIGPSGIVDDPSVRCHERAAGEMTSDEARAIYYHIDEQEETPFRPRDEPFEWRRELQRFVRRYPAAALPTRCWVVPAWQFTGAPEWAHCAVLHYRDTSYWLQCAAHERLRFAIDPSPDVSVDEWLERYIDSPTAWHRIRYALWDGLRRHIASAGADISAEVDALPRGIVAAKKTSAAATSSPPMGDFSADPYMRDIDRELVEQEDVEELRRALDQRAQEFVVHLMDGAAPSRITNGGTRLEWGARGSFVVWLGDTMVSWKDFEHGPRGSLFDLVIYRRALEQRARARNVPERRVRACAFRWALQYSGAFLRTPSSSIAPPRSSGNTLTPERRAEIVAHLWASGEPLATMRESDERWQRVDAYLRGQRGVRCWPELVRTTRWRFSDNFWADGGRYPAIVCPLYSTSSPATATTPTAVHGLLLSHWSDGRTALLRTSKRTFGSMHGTAIPVGGDPATATCVVIAEGPESALSAVDGLWPNLKDTCVYAVGGKSNLANFEAPPWATDIYIIGDDDGGGAKDVLPLAQSLAARYVGRRVYLLMPPAGRAAKYDCNDWARSFATAEQWRSAFRRALDGALCIEHVNQAK